MDAAEWAERHVALAETVAASNDIGPVARELLDGDLEAAIAGATLLVEAALRANLAAPCWLWVRLRQLLCSERERRRAVAAGEVLAEVAALEELLRL